MSQLELSRSSGSSGELEDDFAEPYFAWPYIERTCAPLAGPIDDAARLDTYLPHTSVPQAWRSTRVVSVIEKLYAGSYVLHLDDVNFPIELQSMLSYVAGEIVHTDPDEVELGAPGVDVLLAAVEDLTAWTGMTKQGLSNFLGVSYSTVLSWRRERPERPRHQRIPSLLALWSAVSGAREEFGVEEATRMVWAADTNTAGLPAISADELVTRLLDETSEANLAQFLTDDGYMAGTAKPPDKVLLAEAEGQLHSWLESPLAEPDQLAGR